MHEVWITGAGAVSALGSGLETHLSAARDCRGGLARHVLFGNRPPDPCMCGMIPADILHPDLDATASNRSNLLLDLSVGQALTQAGDGATQGAEIVTGTTLGNIHGGTRYYRGIKDGGEPDISLVRHFLPCAPASFSATVNDIIGRRWTIASACGSGTAALGFAYNRVRHGHCERIVASGVDTISPYVVAGFNSLRLVSARECRPFDRDRDGLNPGEGSAAFVLETSDSARARGATPLARIEGFGEALDSYHHTRAHPEGAGVVSAAAKALALSDATPESVDHVHLHGTGTQANDISEYRACRKLFGSRLESVPVCSTKSMTGHTFGGAGALSAAFCLLTLEHGLVPPTLFLENRDPAFEGLMVSPTPQHIKIVRKVLSVTLGFGGEAFALVLSKVEA